MDDKKRALARAPGEGASAPFCVRTVGPVLAGASIRAHHEGAPSGRLDGDTAHRTPVKMNPEQRDGASGATPTTIDVLVEHVAIVDPDGLIVAVNEVWREFARANGGDPALLCEGQNYLEECARAAGRGCRDAAIAAALIRDVAAGQTPNGAMEYACDAPGEQRWFRMKVARSHLPGPPRIVIGHDNIAAPTLAQRQIRLREHLLGSVEQAVIATDLAGTILYWNPFAERLYGWAAREVLGRNVVQVVPAQTSETLALAEQLMARLRQGESWSGEFEVRHRDGRTMPIHVTNSPLRDERNELIGIIGISTDITEQKKIEKALRLSDMVYQAIGEAIMVVATDGRIVAINPAFARLTGYAEGEVVGCSADMLKPDHASHLFADQAQPLLSKTGHWAGAVWYRRKAGTLRQDWLRIDTIYDEQGRDKLRICMFSHMTDQKRAKETIWQQANFDSLTGLPNRSMFRDRLEHEIQKAGRAGLRLALMFIDLDQFKEVNDTLGHDIGDSLLKQAAQRLAVCVRGVDTVARLGGDEFTVILGELHAADTGTVERVARAIVRALAQPFQVAHDTIHVSASIGITLYPEDGPDADILIKNADQAMYAAKDEGRNQFHYFTPRMQHRAQVRMRMVNDLRDALANHQFELAYQPIVALASVAIHKAEALLRWRHPLRGMVEPAEFIPIAEQTGMIAAIGDWVYAQVAHQAGMWRATVDPLFQVSVNMSPVQLRNRSAGSAALLAHCASEGMAWSGVNAPVIVEITEGLLLDSSDAVAEQLQLLRDAGVQLAIDDFGTGYSALSYLRRFHVDYLKIDQSFVARLDENRDDLSMCEAIIAMAHKLGIKVIAEGIERPEQRDLLARAGCDYGQGFLFSHPMSAALMGEMLADNAAPLGMAMHHHRHWQPGAPGAPGAL
jgi:diguanylate cyclase (GGDEF)-like protein/PAS domain S-box-containing protein